MIKAFFHFFAIVCAGFVLGVGDHASAQGNARSDASNAYLDLVSGYCFQSIFGTPARDVDNFLAAYNSVSEFETSSNITAKPEDVDLRVRSVGDVRMLVDAKNTEICCTQAAGAGVGRVIADTWLFVNDVRNRAVVLDDKQTAGEG